MSYSPTIDDPLYLAYLWSQLDGDVQGDQPSQNTQGVNLLDDARSDPSLSSPQQDDGGDLYASRSLQSNQSTMTDGGQSLENLRQQLIQGNPNPMDSRLAQLSGTATASKLGKLADEPTPAQKLLALSMGTGTGSTAATARQPIQAQYANLSALNQSAQKDLSSIPARFRDELGGYITATPTTKDSSGIQAAPNSQSLLYQKDALTDDANSPDAISIGDTGKPDTRSTYRAVGVNPEFVRTRTAQADQTKQGISDLAQAQQDATGRVPAAAVRANSQDYKTDTQADSEQAKIDERLEEAKIRANSVGKANSGPGSIGNAYARLVDGASKAAAAASSTDDPVMKKKHREAYESMMIGVDALQSQLPGQAPKATAPPAPASPLQKSLSNGLSATLDPVAGQVTLTDSKGNKRTGPLLDFEQKFGKF